MFGLFLLVDFVLGLACGFKIDALKIAFIAALVSVVPCLILHKNPTVRVIERIFDILAIIVITIISTIFMG